MPGRFQSLIGLSLLQQQCFAAIADGTGMKKFQSLFGLSLLQHSKEEGPETCEELQKFQSLIGLSLLQPAWERSLRCIAKMSEVSIPYWPFVTSTSGQRRHQAGARRESFNS